MALPVFEPPSAVPGPRGGVYAAVAANFLEPARVLAAAYQHRSGNVVHLSSGSTGGLYAQISHGAPFDVFLAADERTLSRLVEDGLARKGSRFTYAVCTLMMWSADAARIRGACQAVLRAADCRHIAIANPAVAPYGEAAKAALQSWGVWDSLEPRLLRTERRWAGASIHRHGQCGSRLCGGLTGCVPAQSLGRKLLHY